MTENNDTAERIAHMELLRTMSEEVRRLSAEVRRLADRIEDIVPRVTLKSSPPL